jgi:cobalt-zinc-cadmium efflux system protein
MHKVVFHMHQHEESFKTRRNIALAFLVTFSFCILELVGGFITNSLALTADAWHMLNDALALLFALAAAWVSTRPVDMSKTFGYYRAEILAAFLNGVFLLGVMIIILYDALLRLLNPQPVRSVEMLIIAVLGLAANGLSAVLLYEGRNKSLNVKGAFLHVIADILGSVAVIAAALIILFTQWYQADPILSMVVGVLVFYGAYQLIRDSVNVLLEGVPKGIDVSMVERRIKEQKGVKDVHDLHVWCITPTRVCALSCHIVLEKDADRKQLTSDLIAMLEQEFGIDHTTIQLEEEGYPKAGSEH